MPAADAIVNVAGCPAAYADALVAVSPRPATADGRWSAGVYLWHVVDVLSIGMERLWTVTLDPDTGIPCWDENGLAAVERALEDHAMSATNEPGTTRVAPTPEQQMELLGEVAFPDEWAEEVVRKSGDSEELAESSRRIAEYTTDDGRRRAGRDRSHRCPHADRTTTERHQRAGRRPRRPWARAEGLAVPETGEGSRCQSAECGTGRPGHRPGRGPRAATATTEEPRPRRGGRH